jgi:MFS family permease
MTSSENRVSSAETVETTDHHFEAGVGGRYRQGLSESAVRMNIKKSGYRGYHVLIIAVLALVGFVEGYDLAITGSLLVLAKEPLHLTETDIRWIAVGPTLMLCIGGFAFSAVSDHWSRKTVMLVGLQQVGQYRAVGDIGRRSHHRVDQFGAAVDPEMRLHPEIPLVALLRLMHLGSRALSAFLVEDGALMIVASTIVPMATFSPFAARYRCTSSNSRWPRSCSSSR